MTLKEQYIREYITKIDFTKDNWKITEILADMHKFLGEDPAIDIKYKKDVMLNETTAEAKEISVVCKIDIVFYDLDNKFKKLEFLV